MKKCSHDRLAFLASQSERISGTSTPQPDGWVDQTHPNFKIEDSEFEGPVKRASATCPCAVTRHKRNESANNFDAEPGERRMRE
jgi:hypothetical protein